jgi:hypothetical protein
MPGGGGCRGAQGRGEVDAVEEVVRCLQAEREEHEEARANSDDIQCPKAGQHDEPDWSSHSSTLVSASCSYSMRERGK